MSIGYLHWQIEQIKYNQYKGIESSFIAKEQDYRAKLADRELLVTKLSKFFSACLGDKEGAIWIGDRLHLCKAVPTGDRR